MIEEEGGRFLARWAKRKRAATRGERLDEPQTAREPETNEPAIADDDAATAERELPDVESLDENSDYKPFMAPGVTSETRNAALRKLWASNPLYNTIDMLDDYCEDYTDAACAAPGVKSLWKIGRGFVDELTEGDRISDRTLSRWGRDPERSDPRRRDRQERSTARERRTRTNGLIARPTPPPLPRWMAQDATM